MPIDRRLHFYLKFCEKREHAEDFAAGRLLLRPLRYFKNVEKAADRRGDPHEAVSGWHQPKDVRLEIAGIVIESTDMAAPLIFQELAYNETRLLCLYAATTATEGTRRQLEHEVKVPTKAFQMGHWVALVDKPKEFERRFVAACKRDNRSGRAKMVKYFDPDTYSGHMDQPIFWKKNEYAHQREYRFALQPVQSDPEMFFFDIGDIGDICSVLPAENMKSIKLMPEK